MLPRRFAAALAVVLTLLPAAVAQTTTTRWALSDRIEEVLASDALGGGATWGVYVEDLETGKALYARNPADGFIPASNMKLVTTAAALDVLGPGFRYETRLYLGGPIEYGTLNGAMVVWGSGDPSFAGRSAGRDHRETFEAWGEALRDRGLRHVLGPLVVVDDVVEDPDARFTSTLLDVLRRRGIQFASEAVVVLPDGQYPGRDHLDLVATHRSSPLDAIVGWTNTESDNLYAERLLRTVAAYVYPSPGPVRPGLRGRAADATLLELGVDPMMVTVADGSGLSRDNRLTPIATVALLRGMWEHPDRATRDAFVLSLPLGGYTGTLDRRYRSGDARGNVRAKTGFINGVRTLSGYVTTAAGRTVAFSLMCNGYSVSTRRVNWLQDQVVELLADYAGTPSVGG